jgi:cytochrome c556
MNKVFGILLVGLAAVLVNSQSIAYVSVEEAIQKRIEMFKSSKVNIKKLRKLIRSGDTSKAVPLADFHVAWSKEMPALFPIGSEASTSNGSDASSDIWDNPIGFRNAIKKYNLKSKELRKSLVSADLVSINETFKRFAGTCKGCHKQFRN